MPGPTTERALAAALAQINRERQKRERREEEKALDLRRQQNANRP